MSGWYESGSWYQARPNFGHITSGLHEAYIEPWGLPISKHCPDYAWGTWVICRGPALLLCSFRELIRASLSPKLQPSGCPIRWPGFRTGSERLLEAATSQLTSHGDTRCCLFLR